MQVCPAFAHFPHIIRLAAISMLTVLSMYNGLKKIMHSLRNSQMHPITHNLLICSIQIYVAPVLIQDLIPPPHHILFSMHYDSIITTQTNQCTRFYYDHNNITTHKLLQVLGLSGQSSGGIHLYKTVA